MIEVTANGLWNNEVGQNGNLDSPTIVSGSRSTRYLAAPASPPKTGSSPGSRAGPLRLPRFPMMLTLVEGTSPQGTATLRLRCRIPVGETKNLFGSTSILSAGGPKDLGPPAPTPVHRSLYMIVAFATLKGGAVLHPDLAIGDVVAAGRAETPAEAARIWAACCSVAGAVAALAMVLGVPALAAVVSFGLLATAALFFLGPTRATGPLLFTFVVTPELALGDLAGATVTSRTVVILIVAALVGGWLVEGRLPAIRLPAAPWAPRSR